MNRELEIGKMRTVHERNQSKKIWQETSTELIFDVREYFIKEKVGIKVLSSNGLYVMRL